MNKKILYSLLVCGIALAGCNHSTNPSDPNSSSTSDGESLSNSIGSSGNSSTTSTSDNSGSETTNYVSIDDVSSLFTTYESNKDYDFIVNYHYDRVANRAYVDSWDAEYMCDSQDIQMTYMDTDGIYYTDFFIYDEKLDQMVYYLDSGNDSYSYLTLENEEYFQFTSMIDYFELAGIEWEDDMLFDLTNQKCIPIDDLTKDKIGRSIFGDNPNEYWHKVEISWKDHYITHIDAISIYRETTYYYSIDLSEHGYIKGSVEAPENADKYTNPNQPYYKGKETYTGESLTKEQASALTIFSSEKEMNYSAEIRWSLVANGVLHPENYIDFSIEAEDGNYKYWYADTQSSTLMHEFYLLATPGTSYPICFMDEDFDGQFTPLTSSMDDYASFVNQIYLDRVLFFNLHPEDFIYDEQKGYITAKNAELEQVYCDSLFFYKDNYGGLRIYLKENSDGTFTLDKIETSVFILLEDGSPYSFVKSYQFSKINETTITYPEGVAI